MKKVLSWLLILTVFLQFLTPMGVHAANAAANEEYFMISTLEAVTGEPVFVSFSFKALYGESYSVYIKNTNGTTVFGPWNLTCQSNDMIISNRIDFVPSDIGQYEIQVYGRATDDIRERIEELNLFSDIDWILMKLYDTSLLNDIDTSDFIRGKMINTREYNSDPDEDGKVMLFKSPPFQARSYPDKLRLRPNDTSAFKVCTTERTVQPSTYFGFYPIDGGDDYPLGGKWELADTSYTTFSIPMISGVYQFRTIYDINGAKIRTGVSSPIFVLPYKKTTFSYIPDKIKPGELINIQVENAPVNAELGIRQANEIYPRYGMYLGNAEGDSSPVISCFAPERTGIYSVKVYERNDGIVLLSSSPSFEVAEDIEILPEIYGGVDNVNLDPGVITGTPAGLTLSLVLRAQADAGHVKLDWNRITDSRGVLGYYVYRATSSGGQTELPLTDFWLNDTTYIDTNVTAGATYYYILKPVYSDNSIGSGSNEVSATLQEPAGTIEMTIGNPIMIANGISKEIDPGMGTAPVITGGRTFLPIKAVIEEMGGTVGWDGAERKVTIQWSGKTIEFWIGQTVMRLNGVEQSLDVAPYISDTGRTMLPLRLVGESLGCEFTWEGTTQTVTIFYNLVGDSGNNLVAMPDNQIANSQTAYTQAANQQAANSQAANSQTTGSQPSGSQPTGSQTGSTGTNTTTDTDTSNQEQSTPPWTGVWKIDMGMLTLAQSGNNVSGTYGEWEDNFGLNGVVNGNKLIGTIDVCGEPGRFEFEMSSDGSIGGWCRPDGYEDGEDSIEWVGVKVSDSFGNTGTGWGGVWYTDFGPMVLTQNGSNITGVYRPYTDVPVFNIEGKVSGNAFTGRVREGEFTGEFRFNLESGGRSFTGQYRYAGEDEWTDWNGIRKR